MRRLTPRERRLIALCVLVLAVVLVWLVIVGPLVGGFLNRATQRRELQATYLRNERLIASLPVLRAAAESQQRNAARFALAAPSSTLAAEALKARLQHLATDEGFAVTAVEDLDADAPTGVVRLRADLTITLNQLYDTLRRLESEDAYVVVDYFSVSADRSLASGRLAPIDVRLELSTAWRPAQGRP